MDAYGRLFGSVIFPAWETIVRRRPTVSRLHMLERTQWLPLEELVAMQLGDLRALVRHAMANVPHYTDTFGAAGVVADEIRSYADLLRLPLLSRDDAQASEARRRS